MIGSRNIIHFQFSHMLAKIIWDKVFKNGASKILETAFKKFEVIWSA